MTGSVWFVWLLAFLFKKLMYTTHILPVNHSKLRWNLQYLEMLPYHPNPPSACFTYITLQFHKFIICSVNLPLEAFQDGHYREILIQEKQFHSLQLHSISMYSNSNMTLTCLANCLVLLFFFKYNNLFKVNKMALSITLSHNCPLSPSYTAHLI